MAPERGTALVTGAGRGIGLAIAEGLWRAGFKVAMASLEAAPAPQSTGHAAGMRAVATTGLTSLISANIKVSWIVLKANSAQFLAL